MILSLRSPHGSGLESCPLRDSSTTRVRSGGAVDPIVIFSAHFSMATPSHSSLRVAVIGTGVVGSTYGEALLRSGCAEVRYGSRRPHSNKARRLLEKDGQHRAKVCTWKEAFLWADISLLCLPSCHKDDDIREILAKPLQEAPEGTVIVDLTNPFSSWPHLRTRVMEGMLPSCAELLQEAAPHCRIFKGLNTVSILHVQHSRKFSPHNEPIPALYAGGEQGRNRVEALMQCVGFLARYVGRLRYARNLEAMAELMVHLKVPGVEGQSEYWGENWYFMPAFHH